MRTLNARKSLVVLTVIAVLAVGGTWLSHRRTGDTRESTRPTVPLSTSTTSSESTSPPGGSAPISATPAATTISSVDDFEARMDVPIDPTGSRSRRDEAGARQAAIDYLSTVKQRVLYLEDSQARSVLEAWSAPGVAHEELDATLARLAQLRNSLSAPGGQVWWAVSPLAVKVEAFSPDRARVAVWSATVMASGAATGVDSTVTAPQVAYRTGTVELQWATGGWSVWSVDDVAGPTPMAMPGVAPSGPEQFIGDLAGFQLIKEHH